MESVNPQRFLLRAELHTAVETLITYAYDLTPTSVFVVSDWRAPVGSRVAVRLSFLDIVPPIDLLADIDATRDAGNPGDQAGLRLVFAEDPQVIALLERSRRALASPRTERRCHVLLIEDSGFTRDMFEYGIMKGAQGMFAVDHAEDAEAAWRKLAETPYDLVIVDYFLPAENGASLIARLRRDPRLTRIPVVAISVGGRDAKDATIAAGADLFLDKPLALRDLSNTLSIAMHREAIPERKSILVFDDSPMVLALTREALEREGFQVAVAEDLSAFEQQRETFAPDLILLDVQMPEVFGDDVAVTLREWHGVRVPILLVSSLDEDELRTRAAHAEADSYITKAAGMPALIRRCKELLRGAA
jgi:DNA-binding response OmpR family regulator